MPAPVLIARGEMEMNDEPCDIYDVTKAASELVNLGCSLGVTHLYDSFLQLQFSSVVSSFANEAVQAVNEGVISAWRGMQEIRDEYEGLSAIALFYAQNGIGIMAGAMQIQTGASILANSKGLNVVGGAYIAHGVNNIYEGFGNIYKGPHAQRVVGPTRRGYQLLAKNTRMGNVAYYSVDLGLSALAVLTHVRKENSVEFFARDPLNYERAYKQMSKPTLAFEALIDALTISTTTDEIRLSR